MVAHITIVTLNYAKAAEDFDLTNITNNEDEAYDIISNIIKETTLYDINGQHPVSWLISFEY